MSRQLDLRIEQIMKEMSKTRKKALIQQRERKFPLSAEPAVIHPNNSSTMKVRDNGMIDLFVGTDNGVRIDPRTKSVNFLANNMRTKSIYEWVEIKRNKIENVGEDLVHNVGRDEIHNVKGTWTVHSATAINLISDAGVYIEGRESIHLKSPNIVIDGTSPKDELDRYRPTLGLMFEDQEPWGTMPPFGYQAHKQIKDYERKPRYRREEYDDKHSDSYEKWPNYLPYIRDKKHKRKDLDGTTFSAIYRKRYTESSIEIKANKYISISTELDEAEMIIETKGKASDINIRSGVESDINIESGRDIKMN